ncbi:MAG TPA: cytochrome c [Chthonomonadaceae bacterium]|nr:cytochrome c [Chthonomonadaceae bacterium]
MNFGRIRTAVVTLATLSFSASLLMSVAFAKPPATSKPTAAQIAAGKKVYEAQGCGGCHAINGEGGSSGPDLSKEGADAKHTTKWLTDQVSNPKSHNANSSMPAYSDKVKGKDLTNLVAYLGSLKGSSETKPSK